VLDVGCGPVGLIHFLPQASERIRLDPLLHEYKEKLLLPGLSVAAAGEQLPLADRSVDIAICFNALDHMRDPAAALQEIARVLRPGGTLLLMIHTFPAWTMPLLAIDRLHPHHWTHAGFVDRVASVFRVTHAHSERRIFPLTLGERLKPSGWKYTAAGWVLATTYVVAENVRGRA
jgi:ubiquinone/menaquinone biosynthesis C-methylase UbiE